MGINQHEKLRFTKIFKQQIFLDSVSRHDCQLLSIGHATENGAEKTVLFKEPRFWPILFVSKFWPSVSQAYMLGTSNLGTWTINGEVSAWKSLSLRHQKFEALSNSGDFLGTPGFWKHHLAGHITIWWLRLKLLFRNQIYDTDLCFLLFIINKERCRILSKLYFGLQFPHFLTWLCKKKRAARPWGAQFQPFYRHPPSFEAWDDGGLLLWLAGSSYVQWEAGGSHLTLADEDLSHRNETGFVGGFNKHQRWSRNMMGENKQQASSRMGIYWYTLRSFKLTGKLEHRLIAGHEWIPARDSLKAPPMDPDGWIPQVARWNPLKSGIWFIYPGLFRSHFLK